MGVSGAKESKDQLKLEAVVAGSKYGEIYFVINKGFFYPGEMLTGIVYLQLRQDYPGQ